MPGDYTRVRFNSGNDYSGVLLEQGRVTLDADVNEQVDLIDRRLRADVVDTLARGVISRETPNAFLLAFAGADLTIGPGRALVHGLLAENHGGPPSEYDPVLGEVRGTAPISYLAQPYLPDAATLAPLPTTGTHLAFLDVWRREVSALEKPEQVEQAVALDTTTRLQTAWQVRFADASAGDTCASPNPAYDAATAPSGGRLTTAAVGVPASTDPCTIAPFGGYRGLENRLYRVEVHDPGPLGTATFKWSRDNASLGASVLGIDAGGTTLTLSRLGRDGVTRISVGDWVEVTCDHHELHRKPGELRQVTAVDEVQAAVTLAAPLTAGEFNAADASRHTRVIRWDQSGPAVDAAGGIVALPAPSAPVLLEDGIEVTFDVATPGGELHVGDHWEFAARTADASVEQLVTEPPRGILHHHMKLGVVTFPGTVTDCRPSPPTSPAGDCGCECDVCVTPESHASGQLTIQAAVDKVRSTGGKVCLQVGVYRLDAPVFVTAASSVHIQGKGWRTILLASRGGPAFVIERSIGVTIDLLTVIAATVARRGQTGLGIAIALRSTIGTIIERCVLLQLGSLERDPPSCEQPTPTPPLDPCPPEGIRPGSDRTRLLADLRSPFGPTALGGPLIALDGLVVETRILENVLVGATGIGVLGADYGQPVVNTGLTDSSPTHTAPWESSARVAYLLTLELLVEDNLFVTWLTGVSLEGFTLHQGETRIRGNSMLVCVRAGVVCTGVVGAGSRVDIAGNLIRCLGVGIGFGGDDTRVADNDVRLLAGFAEPCREGSLAVLGTMMSPRGGLLAASIGRIAAYLRMFGGDAIVFVGGLRPAGIDRAQVRGNRVTDVLGDAISLRTRVVTAVLTGNTVQNTGGGGVVMSERSSADELIVEGNQLLDVARFGSWQQDQLGVGVMLVNTADAVVTGNQIRRVAMDAPEQVRVRAGVLAFGVQMLRVGSNSILEVGGAVFRGTAVGVGVLGRFERVDVHDNTIRRLPAGSEEIGINDAWLAVLVGGGLQADTVDPAVLRFFDLPGSVFVEGSAYLFNVQEGVGEIVMFDLRRSSVGVRGNVADAFGLAPAILLVTVAECVLGENRVTLDTRSQSAAAVRAFVAAAAVTGNLVSGPRPVTAIDLHLPGGGPFTVLGNITSGPINVNNSILPAPWDALNP